MASLLFFITSPHNFRFVRLIIPMYQRIINIPIEAAATEKDHPDPAAVLGIGEHQLLEVIHHKIDGLGVVRVQDGISFDSLIKRDLKEFTQQYQTINIGYIPSPPEEVTVLYHPIESTPTPALCRLRESPSM